MKTYVFLDFDGVIRKNTDPKQQLNPQLVQILSNALKEADNQVVIASTWRLAYSLNELKKLFPVEFQSKIVGMTPQHPNPQVEFERERECMAWLRKSAETPCRYVAIDDDPDLYRNFPLVLVDPSTGISTDLNSLIASTAKLRKIED